MSEEKKLSYNSKRTVSYVRGVDNITGEVTWQPLWALSQRPPVCFYCARKDTEHCAREAAPAWFGAECANWLPRDVRFGEVNAAIMQCISTLSAIQKHTWCENYAAPVDNLIRGVWYMLHVYEAAPVYSDEQIKSLRDEFAQASEDRARRQRFASGRE